MAKKQYVRYEEQYIANCRNVIANGSVINDDRTGVGTHMLVGMQFRANLQKEYPLLTTKWVGLRDVFNELAVFITGDTSNQAFEDRNCKIWNEWAGALGQLGPIYPAMWRRRPAAVVFKAEIAPNYSEDPEYYDADWVVKHGSELIKNAMQHCTPLGVAENTLIDIYTKVIKQARSDRHRLFVKWANYLEFKKDFFKIPGCESVISGPGYIPCVWHKHTNKVGPNTLEFIPKGYQDKINYLPYHDVPSSQPVFYIDQLAEVMSALKGKGDRRMIVDCWEPSVLPLAGIAPDKQPNHGKQALACCHYSFQFHKLPPVHAGGKHRISITITMRSNDLALGNPYNMASYAMLLMMVGHVVDCEPYEVVLNTADTHVYQNHIETLKKQTNRRIKKSAEVTIRDGVKRERLEDFCFEDFEVVRYGPNPKTSYKVAV